MRAGQQSQAGDYFCGDNIHQQLPHCTATSRAINAKQVCPLGSTFFLLLRGHTHRYQRGHNFFRYIKAPLHSQHVGVIHCLMQSGALFLFYITHLHLCSALTAQVT